MREQLMALLDAPLEVIPDKSDTGSLRTIGELYDLACDCAERHDNRVVPEHPQGRQHIIDGIANALNPVGTPYDSTGSSLRISLEPVVTALERTRAARKSNQTLLEPEDI